VDDPGPCLAGRVDQDRIEDRAPWRVQSVDPVARLDRDGDLLGAIVERGDLDPRRARRADAVE
jgi:hypothetical protein